MENNNKCTKCESCLMPFDKDPGVRESDKYCSLCFKNGKLCYEGNDLKEFQKVCYKSMRDRDMNPILASFYTWCIRFAPRWKK
jgi:hypothetical protein